MPSFPTSLPALQRVSLLDRMDTPGREADLLHNRICDDARFLEFDIHYITNKNGTEIEYPS